MNIDWIPLLVGLFFGLLPARKLLPANCHYVGYKRLRKVVVISPISRRTRRKRWRFPLVWVDLLRGYATVWLLTEAIQDAPESTRIEHSVGLLITAVLLLAALWMQTEYRTKTHAKDQTVSPTGFLIGMMVALLPPMVAIAALMIGVAATIAAGTFAFGYGLASVVTLATGILFTQNIPQAGTWSLLVAFPLLLSWVRRTDLVMTVHLVGSHS